MLFKCEWFDIGNKNKKLGIQKDGNVTSINISRKWYKNDPFVLASQVK